MNDVTTPQPARQAPASPAGENLAVAVCGVLTGLALLLAAPGYVSRVQQGYVQATINHIAAEAAREG